MSAAVHTALQLGLLYGIATLSTVVSFRFLRFPDLTVDGSFVLGAVMAAVLIRDGFDPMAAAVAASGYGFLAGMCTAFWHRLFRINKFFAGILTMMMLYSVNLRILGGANISLLSESSIFGGWESGSDLLKTFLSMTSFVGAAALVCVVFCSKIGLQIRALGSNSSGLSLSEARLSLLSLLGLGFANSLAALSGALIAQYQRFADVGMGLGVTVNIFASLFLGEGLLIAGLTVIGRFTRGVTGIHPFLAGAGAVAGEILAASIGMISFVGISTATLYLGLRPSDTKLFAAFLLLMGLIWRRGSRAFFLVPVGEFEK